MSDLEFSDPYDPNGFESRPLPPADPPARPAAKAEDPAPSPPARVAEPGERPGDGPVPWRAAASSVPRLRQQPAVQVPSPADGSFQGFAQDAIPGRGAAMLGESSGRAAGRGADDGPDAATRPLAAEPPFWEVWLERARALPLPLVLGGCAALCLAVLLVSVLRPRGQTSVSLSRLRQHPEAFDGQRVEVRGKAGETFSIGGSYVFNLRQGGDTIVVYSRTRRPSLHEDVRAMGTVSIGYLDGVPRVALIETPPTP